MGWLLRLLAFSILIVTAVALGGQSGRDELMPEVASRARLIDPPETHPIFPRMPVAPPRSMGFPVFVQTAGTIFFGTVTSISRRTASPAQPVETVAITFHVESAIRGATAGEECTIAQWIGLWSGGQRYRIGERVLLFLYPPSKLGLTSTVGGELGRFPVDAWGRVLLSAQQLSAFREDPVLGGKSRARFSDFALAVRRASEEE